MSFSAPELAAIDRLLNYYNSNAFDATTNPGGFANDGHQVNFPAALQDLSAAASAVAREAESAGTSAGTATTKAGEASASKDAAETAATNSAAARDKSQLWADEAEDVEVEPGKHSALHHAAKAAAFVAAAAPLDSPAFTGVPTAPTAAPGTNTTQIATAAFVEAALTALLDAAPGNLDTLNELAAALGDDPNFATTVLNSLATKAQKDQNLADIANAATAFGNIKQSATESATGVAEIATVGELETGVDDTRFVTPLKFATLGGRGINGTVAALAAQSSVLLGGIPAWATQVDLLITGMTTTLTAEVPRLQLGPAGSIAVSGYSGSASNPQQTFGLTFSTFFQLIGANGSGAEWTIQAALRRANKDTNKWHLSVNAGRADTFGYHSAAGDVVLTGALDQMHLYMSSSTWSAGEAGYVYR